MNSKDINKWTENQVIKFLKNIGMKKYHFIIDFGCSHGTYTIHAYLVVGEKGRVYAVDKNQGSLNELVYKIK